MRFFKPLKPDSIFEGLGGNGVAAVFSAQEKGPTVLLRCELDALPIQESIKTDYCSRKDGISHKCGHDGHMAILAAVGAELALNRPKRGKVVLLYQPAEENGKGANAVVSDPGFEQIKPAITRMSFRQRLTLRLRLAWLSKRQGPNLCTSRRIRFHGPKTLARLRRYPRGPCLESGQESLYQICITPITIFQRN